MNIRFPRPISTQFRLDDLPARAIAYIRRLEALVGCRIHLVSLGPERSAMLKMPRTKSRRAAASA